MSERIQKVLSHAGIASRREAERLLAAGRIRVNGSTITEPGTRVEPGDRIEVDGQPVRQGTEPLYILMNKPRGCVTTLSDPEGRPTVADYLPPTAVRVFPVGRLDFGSEGLLLFTNDGDLAQALMRPSGHVTKTYQVKVRGLPEARMLDRLQRPFRIDGRATRPASVRLLTPRRNAVLEVKLTEGRKNQVREMFFRCGHPVMRLKRVAYGPIEDPALPPGRTRPLTPEEIRALRAAAGRGDERASSTAAVRRP